MREKIHRLCSTLPLLSVLLCWFPETTCAFTPPSLGLGALLFPVRGTTIEPMNESPDRESLRQSILDASDFFVDAFWTSKVGGGARQLSSTQLSSLRQSQTAEFTKRYGNKRKRSQLLICRNARDEIVACAGVEMDRIPADNLKSRDYLTLSAPLMSNLAVSRKYRRRGLAEKIVQAVEDYVQREWDVTEGYLYVERRNIGAVKLYRKLGYRQIWLDSQANTLLPTQDGRLVSASTQIVCMRKAFKKKLFGLF